MDLKALIAEQKAEIESVKTESVDVVLGKERVTVEVARLLPDDWQQLVAEHPPRKLAGKTLMVHSDSSIGYDQNGLPRDYPAEKIRVGGETVDQETWREIYTVLNTVHRNNVGTVIWGLNVFDAVQELQELGKAVAGLSSASHANRESRRAASKGGSRRKSPATTPQKDA